MEVSGVEGRESRLFCTVCGRLEYAIVVVVVVVVVVVIARGRGTKLPVLGDCGVVTSNWALDMQRRLTYLVPAGSARCPTRHPAW